MPAWTPSPVRPAEPGELAVVAGLRRQWILETDGAAPAAVDEEEFLRHFLPWAGRNASSHRCMALVRGTRSSAWPGRRSSPACRPRTRCTGRPVTSRARTWSGDARRGAGRPSDHRDPGQGGGTRSGAGHRPLLTPGDPRVRPPGLRELAAPPSAACPAGDAVLLRPGVRGCRPQGRVAVPSGGLGGRAAAYGQDQGTAEGGRGGCGSGEERGAVGAGAREVAVDGSGAAGRGARRGAGRRGARAA